MKKSLRLIPLFLLVFSINSQAKGYRLFGKISFGNSQPAKETTVIIMTTDSLITNRQLTYPNGSFMWKDLPPNRYFFKVIKTGYEPINLLIDWKNNQHVNLGVIALTAKKESTSTVDLPEVVITTNSIIQKVDKMIAFPKLEQVKISSNSIDLLQTLSLPGMTVNVIEQKVAIDGQVPVFQINGRPQPYAQILGLKPNEIARIEYSSNSSIRYANQKTGGVINFILKEKQHGGYIFTNLMGTPMTGFLNGTLSSSWRHKKSEFTFLYNNSWRDYDKRWTDRAEAFINNHSSFQRTSTGLYSPFGYLSQEINLGYNLQLTENTLFSANLLNSIGRQHTSINSLINEDENKLKTTEFERQSKAVFKNYSPSIDLFFIHKFKNNRSLEFNLVGTLNQSNYTRNLSDHYTKTSIEQFINNVDNNRKSFIAEGAYRFKIGSQNLSLGIRHLQSYTRNVYSGNTFETIRMNSSDTYAYGEWSGNLKKISYALGTGIKYYTVDNKSDQKSYARNLTTLNLLYAISKDFKISYLLQLTPSLPTLSELSPIEQNYEKRLVIKGNPNLKAYNTLRNRFLISFNKKKLSTNLWMSHTKAFHPISLYTYDDNERFVSEYHNQTYNQQTNVQLDIKLSTLFNCLNLSTTAGWNRFSTAGSHYSHQLYNLYWSASMQAYYKSVYLTATYTRPQKQLSAETVTWGENYSSAILGYKHGNFNFKGGIYYPFTKAWKIKKQSLSNANPYLESVYIKDNANMVVLGISYQFNFGKGMKKSRKSLQNSDNEIGILKVQE